MLNLTCRTRINPPYSYGFYAITAGERLVLLPKPDPLSVYKHTFTSIDPSPLPAQITPFSHTNEKEQSRIDKWERMILPVRRNEDVWRINKLKEHKLRERVYKGIPDRWRRAAWDLLITSFKGPVEHGRYADLLNEPSEFDIQIDLDVPRTIGGHVMFRTRYGLGYVNAEFCAVTKSDVGRDRYFMFYIAFHSIAVNAVTAREWVPLRQRFSVMLKLRLARDVTCLAKAINLSQKAHEWMCYLHTAYSMHSIFRPGFPGLLESIYVQETLMKRLMPGVYDVLVSDFCS